MTTPSLPLPAHRTCLLTLALVIVCLFILKHPYFGIIHDSMLYTVEALNKLDSKTYASDFYFINTYQSKFSITTFIYAKCIDTFGLTAANLLLLVAGQSLWLAGAYLTTGLFFSGFNHFAALALLVSFPSHYGGFGIFSFFEPFYSPRLVSEAFVLFALFFWARRNWLVCLPCMAVAFALHPLMAIPGVVALLLLALSDHKKILWALIPAGLGIVAVASLGVEPFSNLFTVMSGNWLKAAQARCAFLFISMWPVNDLILTVAMFALAALAYTRSTGKQKEFLGATILTAFLLNAASFVFADLLHDVLVIQLQLWRSSWLLFYLVAASFYDLASNSCAKGPVGLVAVTLLCVFIFQIVDSPYSHAALLISLALFVTIRWTPFGDIPWKDDAARKRILLYVFVLLSSLLIFKTSDGYSQLNTLQIDEDPWQALSVALPILTALALLAGRIVYHNTRHCAALLVTASIVTCLCAMTWDRRSSVQRQLLAVDNQTSRLSQIIPPSSLVFWPGACPFSWFYLQRGNFISYLQSPGVTFSQAQAEEYIDKEWLVALDLVSNFRSGFANMPLENGEALFSSPKVEYICKQYHDLDFILIPDYFPDLNPVTSFSLKLKFFDHLRYFPNEQPIFDPKVYIYSCDALRNKASLSHPSD